MNDNLFSLTKWSNFNVSDYYFEIFDTLIFLVVLILIFALIFTCYKILCSSPSKEITPIVSEITEVVRTPMSYSPYDYTYGTYGKVQYPNNDVNQNLFLDTPISPGLIGVKDSGNNHINIFLRVGSKDKIEEISNENKYGKIEEVTTSSTLNTLSSQLNKSELKKHNLNQDKKVNIANKCANIKENGTTSSFKDPPTVGYTTSGEPLSILSSKYVSNCQ